MGPPDSSAVETYTEQAIDGKRKIYGGRDLKSTQGYTADFGDAVQRTYNLNADAIKAMFV